MFPNPEKSLKTDWMLERIQSISVRWRLLMALGAGIAASTALAPLFLLPMLYGAFCILGLLVFSTNNPQQAFYEGLAFGFGYFASNIYWITLSLLVNPEIHSWLVPVAVPIMSTVLALAIALPTGFVAHIPGPYSRGLVLIITLSLAEWLRGYIFQFPWNNFSHAFGVSNILLQPLSVLGQNAYSLLVIASLLLFPLGLVISKHRVKVICGAFSIPLLFAVWGTLRLDQAPNPNTNFFSNAGVRIVQPNIAQADKVNPELAGSNLSKLIDLSFDELPGWVGHIIWPEVALHLNIDQYPALQRDLASLLPAGGALITGTLRTAPKNRMYNSVIAIHDDGTRSNLHDKVTLVPFGEYMPIPFLRSIAGVNLGIFAAGKALKNSSVGMLPNFSTLICYEAIFSDGVTPQQGNTQWLLNVTNDAWFGESTGPYQHANIVRMRSIEEGLPLVRAANTGISIVYDAFGRILAERSLGTEGTINIRIPKPLENPTFFSQNPRMLWILLLISLVMIVGPVWYVEARPKLRFEL